MKITRHKQNPVLSIASVQPTQPDLRIFGIFNPGVFCYKNQVGLLVRVAEAPVQPENKKPAALIMQNNQPTILSIENATDTSDPRIIRTTTGTMLTSMSHFRLFLSDDGITFNEPETPVRIFGEGHYETYGIEDTRITLIGNTYYITYTAVSPAGVAVALMSTTDWKNFTRHGIILPPHNKDCVLFPEKINGLYYCLHRPTGSDIGGNYIWISSSADLLFWGNHQCIAQTRPELWDSERIGAAFEPIKTNDGWLAFYHGANAQHRYCVGTLLLDAENPNIVLRRSTEPIMQPEADYEKVGFFGDVVFPTGMVAFNGRNLMYYGSADSVICVAEVEL
jgi:beta-1,2-mannobiose phosphorylase / 1,2-beta-oligomannan phosphorylase